MNALSPQERARALALINTKEKAELSIAQAWFRLLDEGIYVCSLSTLYRIARQAGQTTDRRRLATHPPRVKPELVATDPNQVWTCYADFVVMPMSGPVARFQAGTGIKRSA